MSDAGHAVTLRELRGFIFDADGTLYRGEAVLPGAAEFIADLRRLGVPVAGGDQQLDDAAGRCGRSADAHGDPGDRR